MTENMTLLSQVLAAAALAWYLLSGAGSLRTTVSKQLAAGGLRGLARDLAGSTARVVAEFALTVAAVLVVGAGFAVLFFACRM